MRTWGKGTFRRVAVNVTDRFAVDATHELSVLGSVVSAVGGSASLVAVSGGSHVLADTYGEYLGNGYTHNLVEYPIFDLSLLKQCMQKVSSSVFGSLDPFSMTEFIVTRLKGAEHRNWMMSRSSLRRAIITGELLLPSLVEVVSNIVGVSPLIVVYLKKTGRKTDGDSLVVKYILHLLVHLQFSLLHLAVFPKKKGIDGYFYINQMARSKFRLFHLILEICMSSFVHFPHLIHVGTYTFRKQLVGDSRKLVAVFLVSSFWQVWLSHGVSTFIPCGFVLASFWVVAELV